MYLSLVPPYQASNPSPTSITNCAMASPRLQYLYLLEVGRIRQSCGETVLEKTRQPRRIYDIEAPNPNRLNELEGKSHQNERVDNTQLKESLKKHCLSALNITRVRCVGHRKQVFSLKVHSSLSLAFLQRTCTSCLRHLDQPLRYNLQVNDHLQSLQLCDSTLTMSAPNKLVLHSGSTRL